jgi:hypothetical protein
MVIPGDYMEESSPLCYFRRTAAVWLIEEIVDASSLGRVASRKPTDPQLRFHFRPRVSRKQKR